VLVLLQQHSAVSAKLSASLSGVCMGQARGCFHSRPSFNVIQNKPLYARLLAAEHVHRGARCCLCCLPGCFCCCLSVRGLGFAYSSRAHPRLRPYGVHVTSEALKSTSITKLALRQRWRPTTTPASHQGTPRCVSCCCIAMSCMLLHMSLSMSSCVIWCRGASIPCPGKHCGIAPS
jgi:hypothetical protein